MRVLLLCPDHLGPLMAGPAIRYHEMARALVPHAEVTLASTRVARDYEGPPGVKLVTLDPDGKLLRKLVASVDVAVVQGMVLERFPWLPEAPISLVIDLYDPMIFEGLSLSAGRTADLRLYSHERILSLTLLQLHHGDFFLVANRRQRDFYLGMLAAVNRINPVWSGGGEALSRLVGVVPGGIPAESPPEGPPLIKGVRKGFPEGCRLIVWNGGLWDWMDPVTLVDAISTVVRDVPSVRVLFWGTRHPNPEVPEMRAPEAALRRAQDLGLHNRSVFFEEWVPYCDRGRMLREADLGVTLAHPGLEARYAHRSRILDYVWAGVPIVASRGDVLATIIRREGLGVVVPPRDAHALSRTLSSLLGNEDARKAMRNRIDTIRSRFSWDLAVKPLVRFLANPRRDRCRSSLAYLGPMASLLFARWPVARPFVRGGVTLARDGMWSLFRKACRSGARSLGSRSTSCTGEGDRP